MDHHGRKHLENKGLMRPAGTGMLKYQRKLK